jgi:hypothetical protein
MVTAGGSLTIMPTKAGVLEFLRRVESAIRANKPTDSISVTSADQFLVHLSSRVRSHYRGVLCLLDADLPEEAMGLARSLFTDSLRLQELEAAGDGRAALMLGWHDDDLTRLIDLAANAKRLGAAADITDVTQFLSERRRRVESYRSDQGVGTLRAFLTEDEAAEKFKRQGELVSFLVAHQQVRGSTVLFPLRPGRIQLTGDEVIGIVNANIQPDFIEAVGVFAARSALIASRATANTLGWRPHHDVDGLLAEIEQRVEAKEAEDHRRGPRP